MAPPKKPTQELGVSSATNTQGFRWDEYINELRGRQAIRKYREMRDNDPIIGAMMNAMEMMLRAIEWRVESIDDTPVAIEAKEFVEQVLFEDMQHTYEEFIAEALTMLPFGFSWFEAVYKRRNGMNAKVPSKFDDGRMGIHKLASRAQWTVEEFIMDENGEVLGIRQEALYATKPGVIPINKSVYFRTAALNNEPVGRSVLRNAYTSYYYARNITEYESIAIERELNGLPIARIPSEYLSENASAEQKALLRKLEQLVRDVKKNQQGYAILPSDLIEDDDGSKTSEYMIDFKLMASEGTRDIDTNVVITRHQMDMARVALADFIMLGQSERGSFALSKNKTDLFLRSLEGYANNLASTQNKQLLVPLWELNGLSFDIMPRIVAGDVAPVNLEELGRYVRDITGSGVDLFDEETQNMLRDAADLPEAEIDPDMLGRPDPLPPPVDDIDDNP